MFTGIVQGVGRVERFERNAFGARLVVDCGGFVFHEHTPGFGPNGYSPAPGDSICVSGVCLTVTPGTTPGTAPGKTPGTAPAPGKGEAAGTRRLAFDVIKETLDRSKLGSLRVGSRVNLEPSVTPSQPLGGHFMQGHVDAVGRVAAVVNRPDEWRTRVGVPAGFAEYLVPKGSIAIDGVSLTLAAVHDEGFEVALIPTTLELTTLGDLKPGDPVNLEGDIIAKTVVNHLRRLTGQGGGEMDRDASSAAARGVTRDLLGRAGMG